MAKISSCNPYITRVLTLSAPGDSNLSSDVVAKTFVVDIPGVERGQTIAIECGDCQLYLPVQMFKRLTFELNAGSKEISVHYGLVLNPQVREEDEYRKLTPAQKDAFETDILAKENTDKKSWHHITQICVNELEMYSTLEFFQGAQPLLRRNELMLLPKFIEEVHQKLNSVFSMDLFECKQTGELDFVLGAAVRGEVGGYERERKREREREPTVSRGARLSRRESDQERGEGYGPGTKERYRNFGGHH